MDDTDKSNIKDFCLLHQKKDGVIRAYKQSSAPIKEGINSCKDVILDYLKQNENAYCMNDENDIPHIVKIKKNIKYNNLNDETLSLILKDKASADDLTKFYISNTERGGEKMLSNLYTKYILNFLKKQDMTEMLSVEPMKQNSKMKDVPRLTNQEITKTANIYLKKKDEMKKLNKKRKETMSEYDEHQKKIEPSLEKYLKELPPGVPQKVRVSMGDGDNALFFLKSKQIKTKSDSSLSPVKLLHRVVSKIITANDIENHVSKNTIDKISSNDIKGKLNDLFSKEYMQNVSSENIHKKVSLDRVPSGRPRITNERS